jgi:hypothetical protein
MNEKKLETPRAFKGYQSQVQETKSSNNNGMTRSSS